MDGISDADQAPPDEQFVPAAAPEHPSPTPLADALEWKATLHAPGPGSWEFITMPGDYKSAIFATRRMANRSGSLATVWFRTEERESNSVMSSATRYEFDCSKQNMRIVSTINYPKSNLEGDGTQFESTEKPFPILPGTLGETMLNWACRITKPATPKPAQ